MTKSSNNTAPSMGLMMNIPGINNLDTLLYIRASMAGSFSQFSLDSLAKELKLPMLKGTTPSGSFNLEWFNGAPGNTRDMVKYNMLDCKVCLELCRKLDPINQIIALCYCSRAWIEDVMLYNTGAMAISCVCFEALRDKCTYNWTRCDWKPQDFKGGEVLFRQGLISKNVLIVDFAAMYPSILSSAGISPESIDIESYMYRPGCRSMHIYIEIS